jgi:hypothetical protein
MHRAATTGIRIDTNRVVLLDAIAATRNISITDIQL